MANEKCSNKPTGIYNVELALWSRGRVDGSQLEGAQIDPHERRMLFTIYYMDVVG